MSRSWAAKVGPILENFQFYFTLDNGWKPTVMGKYEWNVTNQLSWELINWHAPQAPHSSLLTPHSSLLSFLFSWVYLATWNKPGLGLIYSRLEDQIGNTSTVMGKYEWNVTNQLSWENVTVGYQLSWENVTVGYQLPWEFINWHAPQSTIHNPHIHNPQFYGFIHLELVFLHYYWWLNSPIIVHTVLNSTLGLLLVI
jgi:hypothetical protein